MLQVSNFAFVNGLSTTISELGQRAETYFSDDPNTSLIKLRQMVERMVDEIIGYSNVFVGKDDGLLDRILKLEHNGLLPPFPAGLCHSVRRAGNDAVHGIVNQHKIAAEQMRNTRRLMVWYVSNYGNPDIKVGKFRLPQPPKNASDELRAALAHHEYLTQQLEGSQSKQKEYQRLIEQQAKRLGQPQVDAVAAALVEEVRARAIRYPVSDE